MKLSEEASYRGVSNYRSNKMVLMTSAMKELRTHMHFTQLRFHCSKQQGRTFHVTTAANSTGEAVVQYFSGQTKVQPYSCSSFYRMEDDNSKLAERCDKWGYDGSVYVGKWGHVDFKGHNRLYNRAIVIASGIRMLFVNGVWLCDDEQRDFSALSSGDFWKIYVR